MLCPCHNKISRMSPVTCLTKAVLHDHFLTAAHPGFFLHSAWPLGDQDIQISLNPSPSHRVIDLFASHLSLEKFVMIFLGARQLNWGFHYLFWWDSYTSRIPSHVRIPGHHQDVRFWKDRLLFQIRRFREITGRSLHKGQKAFDDVPDVVEKDGVDMP